MKTLLMVDYHGYCDNLRKPVGHSPKVLEEYSDIIKSDFAISIAAPSCIINGINNKLNIDKYSLKFNIVEERNKSVFTRVIDKIKMFYNLSQAKNCCQYDIIWFYNTDFFLFLYFFFHRLPKESYCLICSCSFGSGLTEKVLKLIFDSVVKKFSGIIYTQKEMRINHNNTMYMPDYYYDSEKYEKYRTYEKTDKVVCLGTMNNTKELDKLVEVFNSMDYRLDIIGKFYDNAEFERLNKKAKSNITIQNQLLEESIYYPILAQAKFSVLPYNMKYYSERTSGVLLESAFVGTIPIAPHQLLSSNGIIGVGYDNMEDISDKLLRQSDDELHKKMVMQVSKMENKQMVQDKLLDFLCFNSK